MALAGLCLQNGAFMNTVPFSDSFLKRLFVAETKSGLAEAHCQHVALVLSGAQLKLILDQRLHID